MLLKLMQQNHEMFKSIKNIENIHLITCQLASITLSILRYCAKLIIFYPTHKTTKSNANSFISLQFNSSLFLTIET
jgi:hypothetical protein